MDRVKRRKIIKWKREGQRGIKKFVMASRLRWEDGAICMRRMNEGWNGEPQNEVRYCIEREKR